MENCFSEVTVTLTSILLLLNTVGFWDYLSETSYLSGKNSHWFFFCLLILWVALVSYGSYLFWELRRHENTYWDIYLTSSPTCQIWQIVFFFSFCILQCYAVSQYGGSAFQRIVSTHCKVDNAESLVPMLPIMYDWKGMLNVFPAWCPSYFTLMEVLENPVIVGYSSNYIDLSHALISDFLCSCTNH